MTRNLWYNTFQQNQSVLMKCAHTGIQSAYTEDIEDTLGTKVNIGQDAMKMDVGYMINTIIQNYKAESQLGQ